MRILVNGWFWAQLTTGSGQYLTGLVSWLPGVAADHELVLVQPGRRPAQRSPVGRVSDPGAHLPTGWQVLETAMPFARFNRNLAKLWFEQIAFPWACLDRRADVALVPYWGSPWWRPCPMVVTVHDLIPLLLPRYRGGPLQRAYTLLVSRTARRASAILTDSEASRRDIIAHLCVPPERVHVVPLAVDPEFAPVTNAAELERVRTRYRLPAEPFLLYLGGFDVRKNVPGMLQAYAHMVGSLRSEGTLPRLVVAGRLPDPDSDLAPDPRPLAQALGMAEAVQFIGWVDEADKPALYSLARGVLFLSEYEGFGLPVLEAQSCGCPVLTADTGHGAGDDASC